MWNDGTFYESIENLVESYFHFIYAFVMQNVHNVTLYVL